jgi:hypothetical protein
MQLAGEGKRHVSIPSSSVASLQACSNHTCAYTSRRHVTLRPCFSRQEVFRCDGQHSIHTNPRRREQCLILTAYTTIRQDETHMHFPTSAMASRKTQHRSCKPHPPEPSPRGCLSCRCPIETAECLGSFRLLSVVLSIAPIDGHLQSIYQYHTHAVNISQL